MTDICCICDWEFPGDPCRNCGAVKIKIYEPCPGSIIICQASRKQPRGFTAKATVGNDENEILRQYSESDELHYDRGVLMQNVLVLVIRVEYFTQPGDYCDCPDYRLCPTVYEIGSENVNIKSD